MQCRGWIMLFFLKDRTVLTPFFFCMWWQGGIGYFQSCDQGSNPHVRMHSPWWSVIEQDTESLPAPGREGRGGYAASDPALWPPQRGKAKRDFPLRGSIKNYINIHDVYQSKSWTSMSSALLILSLRLWIWMFSKHLKKENQLERLTSVGKDW